MASTLVLISDRDLLGYRLGEVPIWNNDSVVIHFLIHLSRYLHFLTTWNTLIMAIKLNVAFITIYMFDLDIHIWKKNNINGIIYLFLHLHTYLQFPIGLFLFLRSDWSLQVVLISLDWNSFIEYSSAFKQCIWLKSKIVHIIQNIWYSSMFRKWNFCYTLDAQVHLIHRSNYYNSDWSDCSICSPNQASLSHLNLWQPYEYSLEL